MLNSSTVLRCFLRRSMVLFLDVISRKTAYSA